MHGIESRAVSNKLPSTSSPLTKMFCPNARHGIPALCVKIALLLIEIGNGVLPTHCDAPSSVHSPPETVNGATAPTFLPLPRFPPISTLSSASLLTVPTVQVFVAVLCRTPLMIAAIFTPLPFLLRMRRNNSQSRESENRIPFQQNMDIGHICPISMLN